MGRRRIARNLRWVILMAGAMPVVAGADGLGRLFTTASERAALDRARAAQYAHPQPKPTPGRKKGAPPGVRYTVSGILRRADGVDIAWVNGAAVRNGEARQGATVRLEHGGRGVLLLLAGQRDPVRLKAGQAVDSATATITDVIDSHARWTLTGKGERSDGSPTD